jgi:hypothetical protein
VTTLADSGPGSLRDAIATTPPGGTVDFQPSLSGTIVLSGSALSITKDLTVAGPGARVIAVKGIGGINGIETFDCSQGNQVRISGLTITGGSIFNHGTLTIADCIVTGIRSNLAGGGGIYNFYTGTLTVTDSIFSDNSTLSTGGGIDNAYGTAAVSNSTFSGNSAFQGGAISNSGMLSVTNSTFSGNTAEADGGGIFIRNQIVGQVTTTTVTGCSFIGNSAGWRSGGGICDIGNQSSAETLTVTESTISGNSAPIGGGVYNGGLGTLNSCTIVDNHAQSGGGIAAASPTAVLNCTVSGNSASSSGGGLSILTSQWQHGSASLLNSIVARNVSPDSPDVYGAATSLGHNLIGNVSGTGSWRATDLIGNSAQPLDPALGPLQYNGGATPTMALLLGSPALGAGDPTNAPPYDQRGPGYARVVNSAIDIGAFEVQGSTAIVDGSPAGDQISFRPGPNFGDLTASVNGVSQGTIHPAVVQVHDNGGHDTITINGTPNMDDFVVGTGSITFNGIVISADSPVRWVLDGQAGNNMLEGPDAPGNQWYITATDAGSLGPVHFTHIGNLVGGDSWDVFHLSDGVGVSGKIDGGGGGNTINYAAYTTGVTVDLATGVATNVASGIANIQSDTGGSGDDLLVGNAQDNVLIGNGGNDTLKGGRGHDILVGGDGNDTLQGGPNRSVLIGGAGSDTLTGGKGDDLLMACATSYDADTAALVAIRNEWVRLDASYAQRVSNLSGQTSGGLNGAYVLTTTTVPDDGVADTLTGGGGANWFWANQSQDTVTDLNSGGAGTGLRYDGVHDFVQVPASPSLQPTAGLTLEGWINFAGPANGIGRMVIAKPAGSGFYDSFGLWYDYGTLRGVAGNPAMETAPVYYAWAPLANVWYHVAYTYDAGTGVQRLFLNGMEVASNTSTPNILDYDAHPLLLGGDLDYDQLGGRWYGDLDELRVWNVVRSPAEIQAAMNHPLSGTEPGLVGYWRLDEGSGSTVTDSSGHQNTGTLGGGNTVAMPAWVVSTAPVAKDIVQAP